MAFNAAAFSGAKLEPRTKDVPVPELGDWFDKDESAVWKVRALTGEELAKSNDIAGSHKQIKRVLEAVGANNSSKKTDALIEMMGVSNSVPEDLAKRIEHVILGSVEPKPDRQLVVRLFELFPIVGWKIADEILTLTGLGAEVGKPKASTEMAASE